MTDGTDADGADPSMGGRRRPSGPSLVSYANRPLYVGHVVWGEGSKETTSLHRHPHH